MEIGIKYSSIIVKIGMPETQTNKIIGMYDLFLLFTIVNIK